VHELSLHVGRGELVTLLGANGAGKSTTLKGIVGLTPVASGRIHLDGSEITRRPTERIVRSGLTLVPEGRQVFAHLTCAENLRLGASGLRAAASDARREEVLELFPRVQEKLYVKAGLLSGGEQQMLAIARALMSEPRVLLLDEPSLGLAPMVVAAIFDMIASLASRGVTILLVEQNVERALAIATRGYVLNTGRVEMSGTRDELVASEIEDAYLGIRRSNSVSA
jgi:branched-chain amino acid transport system ATP-binding protein